MKGTLIRNFAIENIIKFRLNPATSNMKQVFKISSAPRDFCILGVNEHNFYFYIYYSIKFHIFLQYYYFFYYIKSTSYFNLAVGD